MTSRENGAPQESKKVVLEVLVYLQRSCLERQEDLRGN